MTTGLQDLQVQDKFTDFTIKDFDLYQPGTNMYVKFLLFKFHVMVQTQKNQEFQQIIWF